MANTIATQVMLRTYGTWCFAYCLFNPLVLQEDSNVYRAIGQTSLPALLLLSLVGGQFSHKRVSTTWHGLDTHAVLVRVQCHSLAPLCFFLARAIIQYRCQELNPFSLAPGSLPYHGRALAQRYSFSRFFLLKRQLQCDIEKIKVMVAQRGKRRLGCTRAAKNVLGYAKVLLNISGGIGSKMYCYCHPSAAPY
jgi:hypothetical protein